MINGIRVDCPYSEKCSVWVEANILDDPDKRGGNYDCNDMVWKLAIKRGLKQMLELA